MISSSIYILSLIPACLGSSASPNLPAPKYALPGDDELGGVRGHHQPRPGPEPPRRVLAPVRGGLAVPGAAGVVGVDGRPVLGPHPVPEHRVQLLAGVLGLDLEWELLLK